MPDDDADASGTGDVPTFEDLVEELVGPSAAEEATGDGRLGGRAGDPGLQAIDGIGPAYSQRLREASIDGIGALAVADARRLAEAVDVPQTTVAGWIDRAGELAERAARDATRPTAGVDRFDRPLPADVDSLFDLVGGDGNLLLLGPTETPGGDDLCARLLDRSRRSHRRRLLVTTDQSPRRRLSVLRGYGAGSFDETAVIAVGDHRPSEVEAPAAEGDVTVERVPDAGDLTRLGLLVNKYLSRGEAGPVLCVHSLSGLAPFVDLERLFRFLHVLTFRVEEADTTAHYHLDPAAYGEADLEILEELFDLTVRYDGDGQVEVET